MIKEISRNVDIPIIGGGKIERVEEMCIRDRENTMGKFDVHLHLGIYIQTERMEELSVNPYWILRFLADRNEI